MAILHSRHQSMRLLGLFRKVLLVDEVHANDAYMHKLLCVLLRFHAAAGGSAILLSATLPQRMRRELCAAFAEGRNQPEPESPAENRYPLLTAWSSTGGTEAIPVDAVPRATRETGVRFIHSQNDAVDIARDAVANGHCICWIRNTVADAREAAAALRAEFGDAVTLFHARYMMGDRLDIERGVLQRFDKASTAKTRAGQILVATQVVEQSLDLDFDHMISDLAPIDLLIQRAGRLHRHIRDAGGTPISSGEDGRCPPVLHVLSPAPDPEADGDWIKRFLPGTAAVYPDHAALWRTTALLAERGFLKVPEHTRDLIEGVYGDEAISLPAALEQTTTSTEGQAGADRSVAVYQSLRFEDGYSADSQRWYQETAAPTRLGEPTTQVCLLRWDGEHLEPLYDGPTRFRWQMSQVSIRRYLVAEEAPPGDPALEAALRRTREEHPFLKKWLVLVPMQAADPGKWQGQALDANRREASLGYCGEDGLIVRRSE